METATGNVSHEATSPSQDPAELTGENAEEGRELDHNGKYYQQTGVALDTERAVDIGEKRGLSASDGEYHDGEGLEERDAWSKERS